MAITAYTGVLPAPRVQTASELNAAMESFITWLTSNAPEIKSHIYELVALASVSAYSAVVNYVPYNCVYGTDGHTYRCIAACDGVSPGVTAGWQSYWFPLTLGFGPSLSASTYLTGGIVGGNYSKTGPTSLFVEAGRCRDDTDSYWISWNDQTITISKTVSRKSVHLFACSDGVVRDDTDVDGVNLSEPIKRYLGRIYMGLLGTGIADFRQNGDLFSLINSQEAPGQSVSSTSFFDVSGFISYNDPERIAEIEFAVAASSGTVVSASYDGVNTAFVVGTGGSSMVPTHQDAWGSAGAQTAGLKPCAANMYFRVSSGSANILMRSIRMKR